MLSGLMFSLMKSVRASRPTLGKISTPVGSIISAAGNSEWTSGLLLTVSVLPEILYVIMFYINVICKYLFYCNESSSCCKGEFKNKNDIITMKT